jgi:VanZ family protein
MSSTREHTPELLFGLWVLVCFASSTETVGWIGHRLLEMLLSSVESGSLSDTEQWEISWILRKIIHIGLFSTLGYLAMTTRHCWSRRTMLVVGLSVCLMAEWQQNFANGRSAEIVDAIINLSAFGAGVVLFRFEKHWLSSVKRHHAAVSRSQREVP